MRDRFLQTLRERFKDIGNRLREQHLHEREVSARNALIRAIDPGASLEEIPTDKDLKADIGIWKSNLRSARLKIDQLLENEARKRGVKHTLERGSELEETLSFGDLATLEEILKILESPEDMEAALTEYLDRYYGSTCIEIWPEIAENEVSLAA